MKDIEQKLLELGYAYSGDEDAFLKALPIVELPQGRYMSMHRAEIRGQRADMSFSDALLAGDNSQMRTIKGFPLQRGTKARVERSSGSAQGSWQYMEYRYWGDTPAAKVNKWGGNMVPFETSLQLGKNGAFFAEYGLNGRLSTLNFAGEGGVQFIIKEGVVLTLEGEHLARMDELIRGGKSAFYNDRWFLASVSGRDIVAERRRMPDQSPAELAVSITKKVNRNNLQEILTSPTRDWLDLNEHIMVNTQQA